MHKRLAAVLVLLSGSAFAQGIPGVLAPYAKVELIQEGFLFLEGPVPTADGGLYFSDLGSANKTYRMAPDGKISVFREKTNGMNGLALLRDGTLAGVEGDGKRVTKVGSDGTPTTLTEGTAARPLLAPNDLFVNSKGAIYFSDPGPRPANPPSGPMDFRYLYYLPPGAKEPRLLDAKILRPNGLTLTKDEKTLIVDDTLGDTVFAFDVLKDGTVKNQRPFAKLHDIKAGQASGGDGLTIDRDGRIYVACSAGVEVFDRKGAYLGTIAVPRQPSNVAFGGPDKRTLYITARQGLYKVQTLVKGPNRPGK